MDRKYLKVLNSNLGLDKKKIVAIVYIRFNNAQWQKQKQNFSSLLNKLFIIKRKFQNIMLMVV